MDISQIIQSIGGLPWWVILVLLTLFGVAFVVVLGAGLWNGFNLKIIKFEGLKKLTQSVESAKESFPRTMNFKKTAEDRPLIPTPDPRGRTPPRLPAFG